MGRLVDGSLIVLFILVVGAVVSLVKTGAEATTFDASCTGGNATLCADDAGGGSGFLDSVRHVVPTDFGDDAPPTVNALWLLVIVFLAGMAGILIASALVPLLSE